MDDVMIAFADDDDFGGGGNNIGDDMEESETRLPNLSGLALYPHNEEEDDVDVPADVPLKVSTRIVPIGGALPGELIGDSDAEFKAACAVVAHTLATGTADQNYHAVLLESPTKDLPKTVSVHTQMHSNTDGPFESMIASFSMASYGGGGVGVAIQFLESGYAVSLVGRGRGDYMLIDHHPRDPATGGIPRGFGNGSPIAIHSNMVIPLSQYMIKTYGQVTPIRYRATFLVPAIPKGDQEEEKVRRTVLVYDEDADKMRTVGAAEAIAKAQVVDFAIAEHQLYATKAMDISSSPPLSRTAAKKISDDVMAACVDDDDEEEPSSEGKRKRAQTAAVAVRSESDESDEKRAKTPPSAAVTKAPVVTASAAPPHPKKADSVPTVVVKKAVAASTTRQAAASVKPKSVTTAPIATEIKKTATTTAASTSATKGKE